MLISGYSLGTQSPKNRLESMNLQIYPNGKPHNKAICANQGNEKSGGTLLIIRLLTFLQTKKQAAAFVRQPFRLINKLRTR